MMRESTWKHPFGLRFKALLVAPDGDERDDEENDGDEQDHKARGAEQVTCLLAKDEAGDAEDRRPGDAASKIEDEEAAPVHPVYTGQQRGECTQHGDESSEKHDLAAVLAK